MWRGSPIMSSRLYISHWLSTNADWRIIGLWREPLLLALHCAISRSSGLAGADHLVSRGPVHRYHFALVRATVDRLRCGGGPRHPLLRPPRRRHRGDPRASAGSLPAAAGDGLRQPRPSSTHRCDSHALRPGMVAALACLGAGVDGRSALASNDGRGTGVCAAPGGRQRPRSRQCAHRDQPAVFVSRRPQWQQASPSPGWAVPGRCSSTPPAS